MSDILFRKLALSLPEVEEKSHFGKADFRVRNKIFAGLDDKGLAYVKLKGEQQETTCAAEPKLITPIKGGWGVQGWTQVDHLRADETLLRSLLLMAWTNIAPKKLQRVGTGFSPR